MRIKTMEKMRKKLVVATGNKNKLREISQIFPDYEVISQSQAGFCTEAEETGSTFAENAVIKAQAACNALSLPVIADDSGICVTALGGAPGVYSARYAGAHGDDKANRDKLLKVLKDKADRSAYFESAIAFCRPGKEPVVTTGRTYGQILKEETGENGFGYDCIFFSDDLKKSFGIASAEEKNAVSHRYRALIALKEKIEAEETE